LIASPLLRIFVHLYTKLACHPNKILFFIFDNKKFYATMNPVRATHSGLTKQVVVRRMHSGAGREGPPLGAIAK
jgi:hypothetical protein